MTLDVPRLSRLLALAIGIALLIADAQQQAPQNGKGGPKGGVTGRLTWFDRQGKVVGTIGDVGSYRTLTISPDGKRIAVERAESGSQNRDIWVYQVATGAGTRLTSDPALDAFPTWSPDGRRIVFTSNRGGGAYNLYQKAANDAGAEVLLYASSEGKGPTSWSPDGKYLLYYSLGQPTHVRLLTVAGPPDRKPVPVVDPKFTSITARFSPDGRWIAYTSNESGSSEVMVRPFDTNTGSAGDPVMITHDGGRTPLWRGDGKEIFYFDGEGNVTAVDVTAGAPFHAGAPKHLFPAPAGVLFWDVSPDGMRFLMPVASGIR